MKIKVEQCWSGGDNYHFRCTMPDGERLNLQGEEWTRKLASELRDYVVTHYNVKRDSIKVV